MDAYCVCARVCVRERERGRERERWGEGGREKERELETTKRKAQKKKTFAQAVGHLCDPREMSCRSAALGAWKRGGGGMSELSLGVGLV